MFVAWREQSLVLAGRQFVRGAVAAGILDKGERTIIGDEMFGEKFVGGAESLREQSP